MKIMQQPQFQPITIVIDDPSEAVYFAQIIDAAEPVLAHGSPAKTLAVNISDWFTGNAQFGGAK